MNILRADMLPRASNRTVRLEGRDMGGEVSFFLIDADPGQGPPLHVHPYAETWIVRRGEAEFTVGDEIQRASGGDVVIGPAHVPHRFENVGDGRLELVCIHPRDTIQQVFLTPPGHIGERP